MTPLRISLTSGRPLLVALAFCAGSAFTDSGAATDDSASGTSLSREFSASPGGRIMLDFPSGGSASIEGWDEERIRIDADTGRNDVRDWEFDFAETKAGLTLTARVERRVTSTNLHVEIKVPRRFDIGFESAGGAFSIESIEGVFEGRTAGGSLRLTGVTGRCDLSTGGGDIEVVDSRLDGEVRTGGGPVFVKDVVGDLEASSGGGDVRYVNVRGRDGALASPLGATPEGTTRETVMIETAGGAIDVAEAPEGALLRTGGGEIRVHEADRFVDASTGGGDITIHLAQGWVVAATGAGDVEVSILQKGGSEEIVLTSGYGDVTLAVPADYGMDLDVDIRITRESSRRFSIESDFPADVVQSPDWEREAGSNWVKHISCRQVLNGGGQKVRVRTTNGDVRIRASGGR